MQLFHVHAMEQEKTITCLEQTYQTYREKKKQLVFANIELEKQTQTLNAQVQEWKGKLEMTKV